MKLNHLRDVLAVAERGSVRAAARHLGIAQPSLTRSVHELERELGVPLFERRARGVVLTPMGQVFVRRANSANEELRRAREEIEQMAGGTEGTIAVCLSGVPHLALLQYAMGPFTQRYPAVRMRLLEGTYLTAESRLRDGTLDLYIGAAPGDAPSADLTVEKLMDNKRVVIGRRGHPLSGARSLRALAGAQWITTTVTARAEEEFTDVFVRHKLPAPRLGAQIESALSLLALLVSTDMLAIAPKQWAESALTRDHLAIIPVKEPLAGPHIVLIRRSAMPLTPAADYFVDMMRRAVGYAKSAR